MPTKKIKKTTTTVITEKVVNTDEKTLVVLILDRSGSMGFNNLINDAIGGVNQYIKDQKKLKDEAYMTAALFDDRYELIYNNVPMGEVELFTTDVWSPRGMTRLYDAIGRTLNDVKSLVKKNKIDKVLVNIVTDGQENDSVEYTADQIKKLIKSCEKEGWAFTYLAANQDAFKEGSKFGISKGNTYNFSADAGGMSNVSATLNNATTYYRSTATSDVAFAANAANLMDNFGVNDEGEVSLTGQLQTDIGVLNTEEDNEDNKVSNS